LKVVKEKSSARKKIISEFFRLVREGRPRDGLKYFASGCVQHNPYVHGGMDALLNSMLAAMKDSASKITEPDFRLRYVLEEGDLIAVYTQLLYNRSKPEMGGLRQVHLFRFGGNKIVEYWDITQAIDPTMPNAVGSY
jgi:predicted SnoaL-like aldol condensation-catalyzing enzyme